MEGSGSRSANLPAHTDPTTQGTGCSGAGGGLQGAGRSHLKTSGLEVGAWMTTLKLKMALKPETVQVSPVVIVIPAK